MKLYQDYPEEQKFVLFLSILDAFRVQFGNLEPFGIKLILV